MEGIKAQFLEAQKCLAEFIANEENFKSIAKAGDLMIESLNQGGKIMSCGNGGSLCDAMHFAEEMTGRYRNNRKALGAMALADPSHMACVGNDYGYQYVFSRFVEGIGRPGDVLLGISTSGNSENVIKAVESAKEAGIKVVLLTGKDGGKLGPLADVEIRAPHAPYADRAQEIHIKVIHCLIDYIERNLNL